MLPIESLSSAIDESDWFPFANEMGIKNQKPQKSKDLKAPMPGLVTNILINEKDW